MTQLVKILGESDPLGKIVGGSGAAFGRDLISRNPRNIGLEGDIHQVVHRTHVVFDVGELDVQFDFRWSGRGFFFRPEPVVGNFLFQFGNRLQVLFESSLIFLPKVAAQVLRILVNFVKQMSFPLQAGQGCRIACDVHALVYFLQIRPSGNPFPILIVGQGVVSRQTTYSPDSRKRHGSQLRLACVMIGDRLIDGYRVKGGLPLDHFLGCQKARRVDVGISTIPVQGMRESGDH